MSKIKVYDFVWKWDYYGIKGHYLFKIKINSSENSQEIERRFSQIESLYELLIKLNPGCRIPKLPEKSVWLNLAVNSENEVKKRQNEIEDFLNYVSQHKYLSQNPYFLEFISNNLTDSSSLKSSIEDKTKSKGIFSKVSSFSNSLFNYLGNKKQDSQGFSIIKGNNNLNDERENFLRLSKGLKEITKTLEEHIEINENKIKLLGNVYKLSKEMKYNGLEFNNKKNNSTETIDDFDNEKSPNDIKNINKNITLINQICDEEIHYQDILKKEILNDILKFQIEIDDIIEIFQRRENIVKKNKEDKLNEEQENFIKELDEQLLYEIGKFKNYREKDLLIYLKNFYSKKYEISKSIKELCDN
jgi:hypothetical protein